MREVGAGDNSDSVRAGSVGVADRVSAVVAPAKAALLEKLASN